jgi:hypothetical protein
MTTDVDYADLDLVGYLYNACYGGFGFSEAFLERLNERRVQAGLEPVDRHYAFCVSNKKDRADPIVVQLFEEMGSKASSGDYGRIHIRKIPRRFLDYVETNEYDGKESVWLDNNKIYAGLLKDFAEEFRADPTLTAAELEQRYAMTEATLARYNQYLTNVQFKPKADEDDSD